MLLDLRETVRNSKPLKYSLITLICIPFALVGIGSYFSGGTATPIAEVNGVPIDQQQLERAYQQQRQQLARMFGGQLPEAFANETALRGQALQQLITQQVLESEVAKQKFAVGDATLGRAIRNLPNFQVDGQFDSDTYQMQLRASGLSVPAFEQSFRDDTALNQFRTGVTDTSFTLPQEAERLSSLARQIRTIEAVRFDFEKAKSGVASTDEEVVAYFNTNKESYIFPQRAKIQYIELNNEELAESVDISDEQAQIYYDDNRGNFIRAEQREASHILLSADEGNSDDQIAELTKVVARIEAGESFADIAKEISDDVGSSELGGSLGTIFAGAMVAEFEEAVYALESVDEVSEPVVTDFGVHLIKLDAIQPESGKPFDEVRDDIIAILKQDEADATYFELRELLVEYTFDNPDSLKAAGDATGLEVKESDWLDTDTDSGPVLSSSLVARTIFSDEVLVDGINSDLIEIAPRHVMVLRVAEHEAPRPKTIDDVRDEVVNTLNSNKATQTLSDLQKIALEQLATGVAASSLAESDEFASAVEQLELTRSSTELDRNLITEIFGLAKPGSQVVTHQATLPNGDLLALRLDVVTVPDLKAPIEGSEPDAAMRGVVDAGPDPRRGGTEFEVMLESLRGQAEIDVSSADLSAPQSGY
ncbi:MAG: peptidyl-prolyl cis-trans isomerase D [Granulosicoccus sp.]|jgi:peptidyl-prolyl cis-trans isomerase D